MNKFFVAFIVCAVCVLTARSQTAQPRISDALLFENGDMVRTVGEWSRRREEIIDKFSSQMYGAAPQDWSRVRYEVFEESDDALGGKATRRQVRILWHGSAEGPYTDMLVYYPNNTVDRVPILLGLNFQGNHSINSDPAIRLTEAYVEEGQNFLFDLSNVKNNRATDSSRGNNAGQWPIEQIIDAGYAVATAYRGEIAVDDASSRFNDGVHSLYPELQQRDDNWATIAAWAWAMSRMADYFVTDPKVDKSKIAVFGFSRLGKAALWAGATDERFSAVISQMSGAGGAKLFRRHIGEDINRLCNVFPHWYCRNFRQYIDRDAVLPFDQDEVMSLIAPRALYVSSAMADRSSDPEGEYYGLKSASRVYELLGQECSLPDCVPSVDRQVGVGTKAGYHIHASGHDVLPYDWKCYLKFLDAIWN